MKMLNLIESAKFGLLVEDGKSLEMSIEKINTVAAEAFGILLRCLYPACPHIAHKLWGELGFNDHLGSLLDAPWPQVDESALVRDEIELMLQVNGKLRGSVLVSAQASKADMEQAALAHEAVVKQANGAAPQKVIVVPGRLVNVVL